MNAITPIEMEGVVERFDDLGALDEGWQATSRADIREEEETRQSVGRVRRAFGITALILLLLNSESLELLVQGLSIGPVQDTVITMTQTWNSEMERHGVARILSTIRAQVAGFVERPWEVERNGDAMGNEGAARSGEIIQRDGPDVRLRSRESDVQEPAAVLRGPVVERPGADVLGP